MKIKKNIISRIATLIILFSTISPLIYSLNFEDNADIFMNNNLSLKTGGLTIDKELWIYQEGLALGSQDNFEIGWKEQREIQEADYTYPNNFNYEKLKNLGALIVINSKNSFANISFSELIPYNLSNKNIIEEEIKQKNLSPGKIIIEGVSFEKVTINNKEYLNIPAVNLKRYPGEGDFYYESKQYMFSDKSNDSLILLIPLENSISEITPTEKVIYFYYILPANKENHLYHSLSNPSVKFFEKNLLIDFNIGDPIKYLVDAVNDPDRTSKIEIYNSSNVIIGDNNQLEDNDIIFENKEKIPVLIQIIIGIVVTVIGGFILWIIKKSLKNKLTNLPHKINHCSFL